MNDVTLKNEELSANDSASFEYASIVLCDVERNFFK